MRAKDILGLMHLENGYAKKEKDSFNMKHIKAMTEEVCSDTPEFKNAVREGLPIEIEEFYIVDEKTSKIVGYASVFIINKYGNAK